MSAHRVKEIGRREWLLGGALSVAAGGCRNGGTRLARRPAVFIGKAASYQENLEPLIEQGVRACGLDVRGRNVLLKPNLVEFDAATAINTHPSVVAAALHVFRKLGAATVRVGEGPGHRRDTIWLAEEAGYRSGIPGFDELFVDLNRDDVAPVEDFAGQGRFYFSQTALGADLIVSLPKMKTHHWAGATLSMKNLFGLVPGALYGWPKNVLHQIGIPESIVALTRTFRRTFAIVDGIIGMEGNGPIQGQPKQAGVLVMGADLRAVDATCCRLMGIDPGRLRYLRLAEGDGEADDAAIEQRGERWEPLRRDFHLLDEFRGSRLGPAERRRP